MAYSFLSLKPPNSRLNKVASTVLNPLSHQLASPVAAPDYNQQITGMMAGDQAPNFALGTPNGQISTAGFGFTNQGNPAFAPVATPQLASAAGQGGAQVDYSQDPILQQTQAAVTAQIAQAEAAALGQEKQNLIRYGDPSLIAKVLGQGDQATEDAAKNNSFSTVAELGRWDQRALSGIDSTSNRNNLYFSSTRGRDRGLQQEDYQRQQARTGNQLQDVLAGIANGLLAAKQGAQATLLGAEENAYTRALARAAGQQYPPGAGASGGASSGAEGGYPQPPPTQNASGGVTPPSPFGWHPPGPAVPWYKQHPGWA